MMSDQQPLGLGRHVDGYWLTRLIDERRVSSTASNEDLTRLATTLQAARSVLATGRAPEQAPAAAASVPPLRHWLRSRALGNGDAGADSPPDFGAPLPSRCGERCCRAAAPAARA